MALFGKVGWRAKYIGYISWVFYVIRRNRFNGFARSILWTRGTLAREVLRYKAYKL